MTKEEKKIFWQHQVPAKVRQNIYLGFGVACFSTAVTIIYALLINPFMWLDVVLNGALALGIGLGKSRVCAVVMLVYFIISKLLMLEVMTASSLVMAAGMVILYACAVQGTSAYHRLLEEHLNSGTDDVYLDDWSTDDEGVYYDDEEV